MEYIVGNTDSLVSFTNSRSLTGRGTLIHLTRNLVVFEVYNPYSVVQMSEVLNGLQIFRGERKIYSGRAVVSNLVATGLMLIVSATLVDPWSDLAGLAPGHGLREEVENFVRSYEASHALRPAYQVAVMNLSRFLAELSAWLEQLEVVAGVAGEQNPSIQSEYCLEIEHPLSPKFYQLFGQFEIEAGQIAPEETVAHRAFARRELHPLLLCSPFVHRSYTKPLGYAGDYQMVNMMIDVPLEGANTYARVVNKYTLQQGAPAAHRNRITMLVEILHAEALRCGKMGRAVRIMNVGCGPAVEIQRFVREDSLADQCDFNLMDFNAETINYADRKIRDAMQASGRKPKLTFIHKSVDELLKEVAGLRSSFQPDSFDLVYCAGLFDYLSDRTCKRLLQHFMNWVSPGGLVVATNVHARNPVRNFMEHVMEWHLIYRDDARMASLARNPVIRTDVTGYNIFLELRKPERSEHSGA